MVLIFSNNNEYTTDEAINWLFYDTISFVRMNENDFIQHVSMELATNKCNIVLKKQKQDNLRLVNLEDIQTYWYRRGGYNLVSYTSNVSEIGVGIDNYLKKETSSMLKTIHFVLSKTKQGIGNIIHNEINKVNTLFWAKFFNLDVPTTLLTNNPEDANLFLKQQIAVITKAITEAFAPINTTMAIGGNTATFSESVTVLNPALFQEKLDKAYELRIFYLNGQFYASAIFSQLDEQTSTDFRNYNYKIPNRTPPYKLPAVVKEKLHQLMQKLDMNSGSIDMVVTKDKRYVFLEVNPIGQFKQVSYPCNYYLEKEVAKYLSNA